MVLLTVFAAGRPSASESQFALHQELLNSPYPTQHANPRWACGDGGQLISALGGSKQGKQLRLHDFVHSISRQALHELDLLRHFVASQVLPAE